MPAIRRLLTPLLLLCLLASAAAQTTPEEVTATLEAPADPVAPGESTTLQVIIDIPDMLHINPDKPQLSAAFPSAYATRIGVAKETAAAIKVGEPKYPKPHDLEVHYDPTEPMTLPVYEGRVTIDLPITVAADASPGPAEVVLTLHTQACNPRVCFIPQKQTLRATFTIQSAAGVAAPGAAASATVSSSPQQRPDQAAPPGPPAPADTATKVAAPDHVTFTLFGGAAFDVPATGPLAAATFLTIALLAGAIFNIMPCVLPVLPLKVMALHQHASEGRGRLLALTLAFSLGIVAVFLLLGVLILFASFSFGQWLGYWWFTLPLGLLIIIMGIGMLGAFNLALPQRVYAFTPRQDTLAGNLGFGALTAILSTPCVGFFVVGAAGWALTQPTWLALLVFIMMGVGMALPYAVLAVFAGSLQHVPRTGPAAELVKQVMGGLLIAVGVWFITAVTAPAWDAWLWVLIAELVTLAGAWAALRIWQITPSAAWRLAVAFVAVHAAAVTWLVAVNVEEPTIDWRPYDEAVLQDAVDDGQSVVLEFTADWCVNCKVLERTTLQDELVIARLNAPDVLAMRVDLTSSDNEAGWLKLRRFGIRGIPFTAVYRPDGTTVKLDSVYTPGALLAALPEGE